MLKYTYTQKKFDKERKSEKKKKKKEVLINYI